MLLWDYTLCSWLEYCNFDMVLLFTGRPGKGRTWADVVGRYVFQLKYCLGSMLPDVSKI